jgi:hypothetical protein
MKMPPKGSIERHLLYAMLVAGGVFALLLPLVGSLYAFGSAATAFILYWVTVFSLGGR